MVKTTRLSMIISLAGLLLLVVGVVYGQPGESRVFQGLPIDPWKAPEKVDYKKLGNDIHVYLKTSTLVFSGDTASITDARVLGTRMVETPHPNLVVTSWEGTEYAQRFSKNGKIDAYDDGEYINVFGKFTLTSADGRKWLKPDVWYKIDKNNGYTQVRYNLWGNVRKSDPPIEIRKLHIDLIVGNVNYTKVNTFWQGWGLNGSNGAESGYELQVDTSRDRVLFTDKAVNMMIVSNARMGFATEPVTYEGKSIEPGLDGYMSYLTVKSQHVFRYTFVNHQKAAYVLRQPLDLRFLMCYLPTREYRKPKMHFFTGAAVSLSEASRVGVDAMETWGYMGYPYESEDRSRKMVEFDKQAHDYGIKHCHFMVNWYPLAGPNPRYPEPFDETAKRDQIVNLSPYTWEGSGHPVMCINARNWFENYIETAIHDIVDFDGDGIRIDCGAPAHCKNTMHGCSKDYSCESLGYYGFYKQVHAFLDSLSIRNGRDYILASNILNQPCANVYLDLALSGEGYPGYPNELRRNGVYTTFLYGRDFNRLGGGNNSMTPVDTPKLFEMLISRCGALMYWFSYSDMGTANWMKYSNPFRIFNVNNCEVHHPFQFDYTHYTKAISDRVFPIIYSRKGEALAVVCNENEGPGKGELRINAGELRLPDRVMVFEPFSGMCRSARSRSGDIRIPIAYPKPWDVDFYVIRSVPNKPEVIWHDVQIHDLSQTYSKKTLSVRAKGIPGKTYSYLDLFTAGMSRPSKANGAEIHSYNPANGMVRLRVNHGVSGAIRFSVMFGREQAKSRKTDVGAAYARVRAIGKAIGNRNYSSKDKEMLRTLIDSIRDNADAIAPAKRRAVLTTLVDVERLEYACDEVKLYPRRIRELVDRLRSEGACEQQWTILGPFANDPGSGFGFDNDAVPSGFDFTASYVGAENRKIAAKNAVGYYLDFSSIIGEPTLDAAGYSLRNMVVLGESRVTSDETRTALLKLSAIGRVKMWLNGKLLDIPDALEVRRYGNNNLGNPTPYETSCKVGLRKGVNVLTFKLECAETWEMLVSLRDLTGEALGQKVAFTPVLSTKERVIAHCFYLNAREQLRKHQLH